MSSQSLTQSVTQSVTHATSEFSTLDSLLSDIETTGSKNEVERLNLKLTQIETEGANMGNFFKDKKGYPRWSDSHRLVHRDVARNMYGPLGDKVVHHRDENKGNFRRSNLARPMSRSAHSSLHAKRRRR